jgi:hypothetical protein
MYAYGARMGRRVQHGIDAPHERCRNEAGSWERALAVDKKVPPARESLLRRGRRRVGGVA